MLGTYADAVVSADGTDKHAPRAASTDLGGALPGFEADAGAPARLPRRAPAAREHLGALAPSGQGAKSTSARLEGGALYFFLSLEGAALPLSSTASFALSAAA